MQRVVYLMSGPAHLPYLVVSLFTLRQHYRGRVTVFAYPESLDIVGQVAEDRQLNIKPAEWMPTYRGKNGQFINKIEMARSHQAGESLLYLDADTMICGSPAPLFDAAASSSVGFVATQFNDWTTQRSTVQKRLMRLLGRSIDQQAVATALSQQLPSVNGGVFVCRPESPVIPLWLEWTYSVRDIFIADETVLHAVLAASPDILVATGGSWNCSPKYRPPGLLPSDVKVWHFHGDSNVRPNKSRFGFDLWWPVYRFCLESGVGNMHRWINQIDNKHLRRIEHERGAEKDAINKEE